MTTTPTEIVRRYLFDNGITQKSLAIQLGESQQGLHKKLQANDITVSLLTRISEVLKHNFFADLSRNYQNANNEVENTLMVAEDVVEYKKLNQHLQFENQKIKEEFIEVWREWKALKKEESQLKKV